MKDLQRITLKKTLKETLKALFVFSLTIPSGHTTALTDAIEHNAEKMARADHSKEVLGNRYIYSAINKTTSIYELNKFILQEVQASLPAKWKGQALRISQTVLEESRKRGWDPVFLLAVIKTESSFNPDARGSLGEIGLMQIRPTTAAWISSNLGVSRTVTARIDDPVMNIKAGAAYLAFLRQQFLSKNRSNSKLYLAAYNMGLCNVRRAVGRNVTSFVYPKRVLRHYEGIYSRFAQDAIMRSVVATAE